MVATTTTLRLKDDWDVPIQPPGPGAATGRFIGRQDELDRLVDEIVRSPHKAILISGYRGVGKTSLVYRALRKAEERVKDELLFVLLNAAQLEADTEDEERIEPRHILENLIRRLYSAVDMLPDGKLKEKIGPLQPDIDRLYRKAVASTYKESEQVELQLRELESRERQAQLRVQLEGVKVALLLSLVGGGIGVALAAAWAPAQWWLRVLPVLVGALPGIVSAGYQLTVRRESTRTQQSAASTAYEFDASLGNLEFDLDAIHRGLQQRQVKTIYVIDELDKLDEERVAEVLKFFKNLFTLSSAIFVFVGGEELYRRFHRPASVEPGIYRGREYTYFSSKYFLSRPAWADISEFVDSVIDSLPARRDLEQRFDDLKRYVAFEASGDFFDIVQRLKDHLELVDGAAAVPLVELVPDARLRAHLQKALSILFEDTYRVKTPSRWQENELIMRELYTRAHAIAVSRAGESISDPDHDAPIDSAVRDFLAFLNRLGLLDSTEEREVDVRGLKVTVRTYQNTGRAITNVPDSLGVRSEVEDRFFRRFERVWSGVHGLGGLLRELDGREPLAPDAPPDAAVAREVAETRGFELLTTAFEPQIPIYEVLRTSDPPYPRRREEFEAWAEALTSADELLKLNLHQFLAPLVAADVEGASVENRALAFPHALVVTPSETRRALLATVQGSEAMSAIVQYWEGEPDGLAVVVVAEDRYGSWPDALPLRAELWLPGEDPNEWAKLAAAAVLGLRGWLNEPPPSVEQRVASA